MSLCSCGHLERQHGQPGCLVTNPNSREVTCPCPVFKPLAQEAEKQEAPDICRCCNQPRIQCTSGLCDCPPNLQPVPQQVELDELLENWELYDGCDDPECATSYHHKPCRNRAKAKIVAWKDREVAKALNQSKQEKDVRTS